MLTVHLADVFSSLSWETLHFSSVKRKLAGTLLFPHGSGEGVTSHDLAGGVLLNWFETKLADTAKVDVLKYLSLP